MPRTPLFYRPLSVLLLLSLVAGCAPGALPLAGAGQQLVRSEKPREASPQPPVEDLRALAAGNQAFALDLYQSLGKGENLFFSPYSISLALAMTYAGARGETERQMADTLRFTLPAGRLHPAFNAVDQALASRKDAAGQGQGADGKGFRLNIVNDLWGQRNYTFLPAFLDLLAANYGAGLRLVDFQANPEAARQTINDYIAEQTEQRIRDLIPQGAIDTLTRLVLTNAIYFNAAWLFPFDADQTEEAPFTRLDGSQVSVPMMRHSSYETLPYAAGEGYQAVALPYENQDLDMVILVPDAGQFERFEGALDAARLEEILAALQPAAVTLAMPGFEVEDEFSLKDTLSGLGMPLAFQPGEADFSGMNGEVDLYIGEVVHKAFVKVDEAGTEAAAATAVIVKATSMPGEIIELTVDRPFIFLIRDHPTGAVLFMGRVVDPSP